MNTRENCIKQLVELSQLEDSFFKSRAYSNAALTLEQISNEEFIKRDDFTDLEGIGTSIDAKIYEFKTTGIISKLQTLRAESSDYLDPKFYKVRKGFITKKITYKEATNWIYKIAAIIERAPFTVGGSYRREKEYIGDLDFIVPESHYEEAVDKLSKNFKVLSSGDYKSSFLLDEINKTQLDIIGVSPDEEAFQLLYLTGSKEFNIRMRAKAKSLGLLLNQTGLYRDGEFIPNPKNSSGIYLTEQDIFRRLDIEYVEPKNR